MKKGLIIVLLTGLFFFPALNAQFYNGHQMRFGKNRVQYNTFYWKFYRFERFDIYSYEDGTDLSLYIADYVEKEIERIERFFDYNFNKRLIFLTYNRLSDFRQSNIGQVITDDETSNIGGVTKVNRNKIFVYFDGDHRKTEQELTQSIAEALIQEMIYGDELKDNLTNSTLITLPDWYLKGLVSYVSNPWNFEIENMVKDGIISKRYEKFNRLSGQDAIIAGHSFWKYIADTYGVSVIPNILYLTRINKNTNNGFLYVLGLSIKNLSYEWIGYYIDLYDQSESNGSLPQDGQLLKRPKKKRTYQQVRMSPDGRYIAYVTNELGQFRIYLYNTETQKQKQILKREFKIDQITDYSYPVLTWHPTSKILAFITEEKGLLKLNYYNLEEKQFSERVMDLYEKILDFSYSPDGLMFVISGVVKGQTDIYVHNIVSSTNEQITNDLADDFHPRFYDNSNYIVFSSNRRSDSLSVSNAPGDEMASYLSVFSYNYRSRSKELKRITDRNYSTFDFPYNLDKNRFIYLSDQSGIINRYVAKYDSVISYVDTVTHYRYFSRSYPVTNYRRNIIEQDFIPSSGKYSELIFNKGKYNIYTGSLDPAVSYKDELTNTPFRERYVGSLKIQDSLKIAKKKSIPMSEIVDNSIISGKDTFKLDEITIDIDNYVFEREKLRMYNEKFRNNDFSLVIDTIVEPRKMYIDYETSFYVDYLVNQVDFNFLNQSYQTFTGGAVYFNPGFNLLFKVGAHDLFEDYRLIGGMRLATDFDSNEYLLSFENLKKRIDKQIIFHRQVFKTSTDNSLLKIFSHEFYYSMSYPFNQVAALKGTATFRTDRIVFLSTDLQNMNEEDLIRPWLGLKFEYIYDDTRLLGVNLYNGLRYKIFAEGFKQINERKSDMIVLGADFRYYLPLHRTFIWANRFAASTSFGNSPLIYYLGSVDNWINFGTKIPTFDESVPIDYSKNYAYQTVATNMRGFTQNIRNGNNFALVNSELRWPVFRYFANHPISSSFLNNFQVIGFFDMGSAWTGLTPWSGKNAYDTEEYENGPIKVVIDSNRDPIVYGYGFGLRSRLLGYFVRLDWAWGIENRIVLPRIFYFSLNLDF